MTWFKTALIMIHFENSIYMIRDYYIMT